MGILETAKHTQALRGPAERRSRRQPPVVVPVDIAGRRVGPGCPCFVIAEAGVNHNGDIALAKRLIDAAVAARADAVKFQTFRADRLVTPRAPKAAYQERTTRPDESQLDMLRRLELPAQAHRELAEYSRQRGILFLSTPFEAQSVDLLSDLGVPAFKISSGDLTNLPLLAYVARQGKPMIVSTGMSTLPEVEVALRTIRAAGMRSLVLLHCVSSYPASPGTVNLRAMQTMAAAFRVPIGYSDHTMGIEVALAAVALGACVLEKHLTLDCGLPGPDHASSIEPQEFNALVRGVRVIEAALGDGRKVPSQEEQEVARVARRSLVAAKAIPSGTALTEKLVAIQRPGTGIAPKEFSRVMGRRVTRPLAQGELLDWAILE